MARLVKTFIGSIGGITSRMTGGDTYEVLTETDRHVQKKDSPIDSRLSLSSEEDSHLHGEEDSFDFEAPKKSGTVNKWTNYLHGWQERFFVVGDGILSYYKSEFDTQYGCRGSISLYKVKILLHEFDELRFDIRAHDCTYFLRASTVEEKDSWVEAIEANRRFLIENRFGLSSNSIRRQGSILSLSGLSQASTSSFKMGHDLHTKLAELETYRDILCRQVDTLQAYFESLAESNSGQSGGMTNGISNSAESIDDIPEENTTPDRHPAVSSQQAPPSPLTRSTDNKSSNHHSPLPSRYIPKGHRRADSDPFAFKPMHSRPYQRSHSHAHFAVGGYSGSGTNSPPDLGSIDFRGEAITFKATTAGIIASLSHCMDVMSKREEYWQKKFEKEQERRRKAEFAAHSALNGPRVRAYEYAGPDFEEGPHSALKEEEFFDALEMAFQNDEVENAHTTDEGQKQEQHGKDSSSTEVQEEVDALTLEAAASEEGTSAVKEGAIPEVIVHKSRSGITHRMSPVVDMKVSQYARYIFEPVDTNWSVVHEDGDMKVYRRELEEDGVVVDPLKASYTAKGISANEVINFFFDKETRLEWEGTLESVDIVETLTEDTIIFHQLHKRVWPSTQRETLFCSHLCTLPNAPRPENMVGHTWMVCNFSIDHDDVPANSKLIRATLHIGMVCQTIASRPVEPGKESELSRDEIQCKIIYAANVNPGGWAPPSVVRTIGKRELCKFLRKFSSTIQKHALSTPLTL